MLRFWKFVRSERIRILHVHGSSIFFSRLASMGLPSSRCQMIWHDHYGRSEFNDRSKNLYRLVISGAAGVIAVNQKLVHWACEELGMSAKRVWYVPNFVKPSEQRGTDIPHLPGVAGSRIVCIANLRPQKDHLTLIRAMRSIVKNRPEAHLLLIGAPLDPVYTQSLYAEVKRLGLETHITFFGCVENAASLLRFCDVGVLSSASEGLPLSLLEYGWAGLPSVATAVGQCPEVLNHGEAGLLVDSSSPEQLANALEVLLNSARIRQEYSQRLHDFVKRTFDPAQVMNQICGIYETVLSEN
jgi:glycosyltransferase involved in cell wall biosynthesis